MAALPFCFIYPQSEGQKILGPRFALGDRLRNIASPYSCLRKKKGSLSNVGGKGKTTKLNEGVHSMKQGCVLLVAIYIDGCFYR